MTKKVKVETEAEEKLKRRASPAINAKKGFSYTVKCLPPKAIDLQEVFRQGKI